MAEPIGKICVLCGVDCAHLPRVKDRKGRYYCQTCHDEAIARKKARQEAQGNVYVHVQEQPPAPQPTLSASSTGEEDLSMLSQILDDTAGHGYEPPALPDAETCPECHTALGFGAVICINCGYDLQSHQQMNITTAPAPIISGIVKRSLIWPYIVGIACILYGLGGLIMNGLNIAASISSSNFVSIGRSVLMLILAAMVTNGGVQLVMRRQNSLPLLKRWAMINIVLNFLGFGFLFLLLTISSNLAKQVLVAKGFSDEDLSSIGLLFGVYAGLFVAYMTWPVFILIWFTRSGIEKDVGEW